MEIKKSYKADLDRHWLKRFLIGLAIALSLFVAVLEFPVRYGGTDTEDDSMDDVLQEMAMRKKQERQDMIAVVEPSRPRKKQQQKIKVVDKIQKDLQNIADISKKRIVGDEEGNGEKNGGHGGQSAELPYCGAAARISGRHVGVREVADRQSSLSSSGSTSEDSGTCGNLVRHQSRRIDMRLESGSFSKPHLGQ